MLSIENIEKSYGGHVLFDGVSFAYGNHDDAVSDINLVIPEGKTFAFVGLERTSAVLVYDITDPQAPRFLQLLRNTTDLANGDISPEGMKFVPAAQSPTGKALLLVGYEVSGSMAVFQVE